MTSCMIDKANAINTVLERTGKLAIGHGLDLRTYKRDRSVVIVRKTADTFTVMQDGFEKTRHESDHKGLRKLLKTLLKAEFPRSNKIRLYTLNRDEAASRLGNHGEAT